jgi:spermidine/putrescine-binding protein
MALTNPGVLKVEIESLYATIATDKTKAGARSAIMALNEIRQFLNTLWTVTNIAQTDAADANVAAFIGGGEGDALAAGDVFRTTNATNDLTDNAFATAKGSAVAVGDVYAVTAAGTGVVYLGNNEGKSFDFAGETTQDFVSYGA